MRWGFPTECLRRPVSLPCLAQVYARQCCIPFFGDKVFPCVNPCLLHTLVLCLHQTEFTTSHRAPDAFFSWVFSAARRLSISLWVSSCFLQAQRRCQSVDCGGSEKIKPFVPLVAPISHIQLAHYSLGEGAQGPVSER